MTENKLDIILSGDPERIGLCGAIAKAFAKYHRGNVFLMLERNPALAFNKGAKLAETEYILCCAGDLYVSTSALEQVKPKEDTVFYIQKNMDKKRQRNSRSFTSGAFIINRKRLLKQPIPISPDFAEEVLFPRATKLKFKPFFSDAYVHFHLHTFSQIFEKDFKRTMLRAILKGRGILAFFYVFPISFLESVNSYLVERRLYNVGIKI